MSETKSLAAAAILSAIVAISAAQAQAQTTPLVEVADATIVPMVNVSADALEDMDVYNAAGQKIGDVEAVLGTDGATPTAVAVDFDRSAGFGSEDRVVPLQSLTLNGVRIVLSADAAAVAALPVYND